MQLQNKGFWKFAFEVAIPSITGYHLDRNGKLQRDGNPIYYYCQPWEYEADQLGGVYRINPKTGKRAVLENLTYWDLIKMIF